MPTKESAQISSAFLVQKMPTNPPQIPHEFLSVISVILCYAIDKQPGQGWGLRKAQGKA